MSGPSNPDIPSQISAERVDLFEPTTPYTAAYGSQGGNAAAPPASAPPVQPPGPAPYKKKSTTQAKPAKSAGKGGNVGAPPVNPGQTQQNDSPAKNQKGRTRPIEQKQGARPRAQSVKQPIVGQAPTTGPRRDMTNSMRLVSSRKRSRQRAY